MQVEAEHGARVVGRDVQAFDIDGEDSEDVAVRSMPGRRCGAAKAGLAMTVRVNDYLSGMFSAVGITLVDFKIEFGRVWENDFSRVLLADEISPDSCRLWDTASGEKLDKDRFRRDLGNVIESYTEVARRLGIMKGMPTVIQGGLH